MKQADSKILTKGSTVILRLAVLMLAMAVAAFCIFAIPSMWSGVSDEYPEIVTAIRGILIAMTLAAIPFFVAIYHALKLLGYIDKDKAFSVLSVRSLKKIALSALAISLIYMVSLPMFYIWADRDDAPGLVIVGMILVAAPLVVAVFSAVLQRLLREAIRIKSENELTV